MTELFLKYTDENGEERRVPVDREEFVIGRHSENDLSVADSRLSRQHVRIQRFADVFVVSDLDSSNGTKLNDADLEEPVSLADGDRLDLGGGLVLETELVSDDPNAGGADGKDAGGADGNQAAAAGAGGGAGGAATVASRSDSGGSGFGKAFLIAPVLALLMLFFVGGALFLIGNRSGAEVARTEPSPDEDLVSSRTRDDRDRRDDEDDGADEADPNDGSGTGGGEISGTNEGPAETEPGPGETSGPDEPGGDGPGTTAPPPPEESDETGKVRAASYRFMRQIATSNQKPVLLTDQLRLLENKIGEFRGSRALAANIRSARGSAAEIRSLAAAKNLRPQFLAAAALARLGNRTGDVAAAAREMADVLDDLRIQIGNEQPDDNLIMIAAYDEGARGDTMKMRNKLQVLGKKNPARTSEIRTIWYLKNQGEITDAQFEFALRFLAVGTITQNPKAFSVDAEALVLN